LCGLRGKKVYEPKEEGGLGMVAIRRFDTALLGKWIWWLGYEKKGLSKEVLDSKYGGWRDLRVQRNCISKSLWWRDLKEVLSLEGRKDKFEDNFKWEVGNGREIRLWKDKWAGNTTIKDNFPRLFSICSNKESSLWQAWERTKNL